MKDMTNEQILDIPINDPDCGASTIREYFRCLAAQLWVDGESFSGKRPFGNSGWDIYVIEAACKGGLCEHTKELSGECGYGEPWYEYIVESKEEGRVRTRIAQAIREAL